MTQFYDDNTFSNSTKSLQTFLALEYHAEKIITNISKFPQSFVMKSLE